MDVRVGLERKLSMEELFRSKPKIRMRFYICPLGIQARENFGRKKTSKIIIKTLLLKSMKQAKFMSLKISRWYTIGNQNIRGKGKILLIKYF